MANINVTFDEMKSAAGQLRNGKDEINNKLTELSNLIDNLIASGYVTDLSSVAFNDTFDQFITGLRSGVDALDGMSNFLITAADSMQQTDEQLANAVKN
jgi:WXG100 family type VII secretion target